ncbi:MAG TPA: RNase H family protein [Thermoanaerobaculia bacterium]|nr:RNase H family protein [Thermoanaerobaculia bacterium]
MSAGGGKGGWAALVRGGGEERQKSGARRGASANQMDVAAAAELLESLPAGARIAFHTASDYLRNGARSWLPAWRSRGWKTKDGRPVANRELWERLARVLAERDVVWPAAEHAPPELAALEPAARDARRGA